MKITASIYNEVEGREVEIKVTGEYTPPSRGKRDEYGVQMEPDEPGRLDDVFATVDGEGYELNDEEKSRAAFALWDAGIDSDNNE